MTQKRKTLYRRLVAIGLLPLAAFALAPDFDLSSGSTFPQLAAEQAEQPNAAEPAITPQPQSQLPQTAPIDEELTFDETAFALNEQEPALEAAGETAPAAAELLIALEPNFKSGMSNLLSRRGQQETGATGSIQPVIGAAAPNPSTGGGGKPAKNNGNPSSHEDQAGQTPGDDNPATGSEPSTDDPLPGNSDSKPVATVPEPSSLALLIVGVIGLLVARRRIG